MNKQATWAEDFKRKIKDNVNYAGYVLKHKANIIKPMTEMNLPLSQSLSHDISKFRPSQFGPYRDWFFGPGGRTTLEPSPKVFSQWRKAVRQHYKGKNDGHHWKKLGKDPETVPINTKMETVADWYAVGKTIRGSRGYPTFKHWYQKRREKLPIDNTTKTIIDYNLGLLKMSSLQEYIGAAKSVAQRVSNSSGVTEAAKRVMNSKAMQVISKLDDRVSVSRVGKELKLWNDYGKAFYPKSHKVSKFLLNPAIPTIIPGLGEVPMVATTIAGAATRAASAAYVHNPKRFLGVMEAVRAIS